MIPEVRYRPCGCAGNDAECGTCFGTGSYRVATEYVAPVKAPKVANSYDGRFQVAICRDGWAKPADGFLYPRWVVAHSHDGKLPAARYKNGGPVHLIRSTAMKAAPLWMATFAAYVANEGGLSCDELTRLAPMFRAARGVPRLLLQGAA